MGTFSSQLQHLISSFFSWTDLTFDGRSNEVNSSNSSMWSKNQIYSCWPCKDALSWQGIFVGPNSNWIPITNPIPISLLVEHLENSWNLYHLAIFVKMLWVFCWTNCPDPLSSKTPKPLTQKWLSVLHVWLHHVFSTSDDLFRSGQP